ncbi:MAG: diacylglycerol/polyprenol kinase family protein [Anaerolineae bacterium]
MNNILATILTFVAVLAFLRLMDFFASRGWIDPRLSRKIIHIGTGPIFVLCWLMFDESATARWLAALVPLAITAQFALVGLGWMKDEAAVQAISRSGDRREILRGPLFYGIVFVVFTLLYWKESPIGIVALMMLCGGDGLADVIGRRVRSARLPWNRGKSVAGSLSVFFGGWLLALLIVWIYTSWGVFPAPFSRYLLPLTAIALASTAVESLPFRDIDNLTLPLAALLTGILFF